MATEELHPIARALLGGECDCEPKCADRRIGCAVCAEPTVCLAFIWHAVKMWNRDEAKRAEFENRRADFIRPSEIGVACEGDCTAKLFAAKHEAVQREHATTNAYLAMLFRGVYNPESLAWLRKNGCSKQVNRVLNEEGNKSHG